MVRLRKEVTVARDRELKALQVGPSSHPIHPPYTPLIPSYTPAVSATRPSLPQPCDPSTYTLPLYLPLFRNFESTGAGRGGASHGRRGAPPWGGQ